MIDFVCTGEECLNCPLPDCMRESNNTCRAITFRIDGERYSKNGARFRVFDSSGFNEKEQEKTKEKEVKPKEKRIKIPMGHRYKRKPPEELKRPGRLSLIEDETGRYYLRAGKDGIPYRQSVEAHERELQRQREYYKLRKNKERTAV